MKAVAIMLVCLTVCGPISGCSSSPEAAVPSVSKASLAADVTKIVEEVGVQPTSVTCRDDLFGKVGQSTQCVVEAVRTDALLAPIVTVTSVDGSTVKWDLKPALTQSQLERTVVEMVQRSTGTAPDSVSCEAGLEGKEGNEVRCNVVADGATVPRTVKVTGVDDLQMHTRLLPN